MSASDSTAAPTARVRFPTKNRWDSVTGVMYKPKDTPEQSLIGVTGRNHRGELVEFWTNLPNAMFLMNMLTKVWDQTRTDVPSSQPAPFSD